MTFRKFGKILVASVVGLVVLVLLLTLTVKLALDRAPHYQVEIKNWVYDHTGFHVRFAHVSPTLRWYGPELYFEQLELRSKDDHRVLARAAGGRLAFDIWQLIRSGKLLAGRIQLDAPNIVIVRLGPSSFALAAEIALAQDNSKTVGFELDDLPAGVLAIRGARVTLQNWNAALTQLILSNVNLELRREAGVKFSANAVLPSILGGTLDVTGSASGSGELESLAWDTRIRASDISFPGWRLLLPEYLSTLDAGSGAFDLSSRGHGRTLAAATLEFSARAVNLQLSDGTGANFQEIGGYLSLAHDADRWTLRGRHVRTVQAGRRDPPSEFDVTWRGNASGVLNVRGRASYLRAESLLPLAGLLPLKDIRDQLHAIAPTGEWSDTILQLRRATLADSWLMQVRAKFRGAGFAPSKSAPGLRGLTGTLMGTESGGQIALDTRAGIVSWPAQWPQPVELETLKGVFYWKRTPDQLLLATPRLEVGNRDASTLTQFSWQQPADGTSPLLTLVSTVENGNAADARYYLPRQYISPQTLEWLNRAFVVGHLSHANVVLRGPVRNFPFRDGSGLFLARCAIDGMTLEFHEGWPRIENLSAVAEFRNQGLTARALHARAGHIDVDFADARFADFKNGELEIHTTVNSSAAAAIEFLRATPLDALAEKAFSSVEASGSLHTKIDLFLPFKDFDQRRVLVHANLNGVSVNRRGSEISATGLSGDVDVDGAQVAHADIRGQLLGGAFQVFARAPRNKALTRTQLGFHGVLRGEALHAALGLPAGALITGQTEWRAVLKLAPEPSRERSLRVTANLAGLELKLPEPLAKPNDQSLPSWLELQWPQGGGVQGRFSLGMLLRGALVMEPDGSGLRIAHAALNFGTAEPRFSETQILNLSGTIPRLNLTGWQKLAAPDHDAKPLASYLRTAKFEVGELDYLGFGFRDLAIDLNFIGDGWQIGLGGSNQSGTITLPPSGSLEPWNLTFAHLSLFDGPADEPRDDRSDNHPNSVIDARAIPSINFHAQQMTWGERKFGEVQASLSKQPDGVNLDKLSVSSTTFGIEATGGWRGKDAGTGRIEGVLKSSDVRNTLTQLGYAQVIEAKSGYLSFELNWVGAPTAESLSQTTGHVQVSLDRGQILGLKPGAGRVLGLASIAALPRRLALDFSDLTDKGLAFDTVRGDFELRGGNAYTENVLLKGPAAEIGLIGRIGLKNRDYDQTAVVTGSFGNSLPLAGVLAGGPVVGAAVLVFTQVFKQPLRGLARGYYRIRGGWDNPMVERKKSADATAAAEVQK